MPAFLVDSTGFATPRYPEARARIVEIWKGRFGANSPTASDTTNGKIIDTFALGLALAWEGVGASWADGFFRMADEAGLDAILDLFGKRRLEARASTASLVWYGTNATALLAGRQAEVAETDALFATDVDATIGTGDLVFVVRTDVIDDTAELYRVTIDGTDYDYVSQGGDTAAEIVEGLRALIAAGTDADAFDGGIDADGNGVLVVESDVAIVVSVGGLTDGLELFDAVRVAATCTVTGATTGLAGTIDTIATPVAGAAGVTNTADAVLGRARETNAEFRIRHLQSLSSRGRATDPAIRGRLLTEVDGVTFARVVSNRTSVVDAQGRPAHSFETYVIGGTDEDVAQVIFENMPSGIQPYGSTTVVVLDELGDEHEVGFSRPTELYLHLRITVTPGEGYPTTGTPLVTIADALIAFLSGSGAPGLGVDLYRVGLMGPIVAAVPGIASLLIETDTTAAPGDPPTFVNADVAVADGEIIVADSSRITVQV